MKNNYPMFVYLVLSVLIIGFFAKSLDLLVDRAEPMPTSAPQSVVSVYTNDEGELKYASGECNLNSDCTPTGCSEVICGSEETATTCELKPDAPTKDYNCGCFEGSCAWIKI